MTASTHVCPLLDTSRATITRHIEIDGLSVGPDFTAESDRDSADNEAAHRWMAKHHPGSGYSIVSTRLGRCCRRASYAAAVHPKLIDYGAW